MDENFADELLLDTLEVYEEVADLAVEIIKKECQDAANNGTRKLLTQISFGDNYLEEAEGDVDQFLVGVRGYVVRKLADMGLEVETYCHKLTQITVTW